VTHEHDHEHVHGHDHDEYEHHHHDFAPRHFIGVTPGLLVDDVQAAAEYYRDVLGFEIRFTVDEPATFGIVDRADVSVHLTKSDPPGRRNGLAAAGPGNGADFYVVVTDIDELYAELQGRDAKVIWEPHDMSHGMREFIIEDLNGYRMIFGEPVKDSAAQS
jgi:uncharacterized glyoxalase superfamily protein PhnB